jgi:hypothetical protein
METEHTDQEEGIKEISRDSYEIRRLRQDMLEFEERVATKLHEFSIKLLGIQNSLNRVGATIGGYTVKELMALKQLGISPKDILSGQYSQEDGETTQGKSKSIPIELSKVQRDNSNPVDRHTRNKEIDDNIKKYGYNQNSKEGSII